MVALQIRDVPEDVRRALAERAAARGQSLQSYLLTMVTDQAHRATNLALLERFGARQDGSRLSAAQATVELDRARHEREATLSGAESDAP